MTSERRSFLEAREEGGLSERLLRRVTWQGLQNRSMCFEGVRRLQRPETRLLTWEKAVSHDQVAVPPAQSAPLL